MRNPPGKQKKKHARWRDRRLRKKRQRRGLTLGFLILILLILAGMGVFMVAMHQSALSSDLSASRVDQKISAEKARQKKLCMSLARLKSPGRVTREAIDVLGFTEPNAVVYLKYSKDGDGNIVCQSNYETTTRRPTRRTTNRPTGQEEKGQEETGQEEPQETGKEQASIKTEIPSNTTGR